MTKYLILLAILIALYLYWKYQQKTLPQTDDIIERKGKNKETFYEASDFELSDEDNNSDHD